jgi:predicted ATPase/Tfp pilus assembly protein PilF
MEIVPFNRAENLTIRTPDQRLRVFISSSIHELSQERDVVKNTIEGLNLIPVLFESGARPHPPQDLYRAYLLQSHIFIGIYWQSYGWVAPDMDVSGLEDEYRLAEKLPRLIYIKNPAPKREPDLNKMLKRIKDENSTCYKYFSTDEELEALIKDDLVLILSESFERSLMGQAITRSQAAGRQSNLPNELNSFIGRAEQIASLTRLFKEEETHLVTLTGPGGVGKTRLALKVASMMQDQFEHGVWQVEFASLADPSLIPQHVANAFGLREEKGYPLYQTLLDYLSDKNLLLVLDNCEHIIDEVAQLVQVILCGAPKVRILTTSREPLGLAGENIRDISPLSIPSSQEQLDSERLTDYEAVNLFVERAKAISPGFSLTDQNASGVVEICAKLDGIPLAIELAAARVRVLSVDDIAARLDDRFRLLIGNRRVLPRQQTLKALIDWSYDLLTEKERVLFRRLSIFSGGWTLQAIEEVCSGGIIEVDEVLDLLSCLIDKSLVVVKFNGKEKRYQFLDTILKYSQVRLLESNELDEFTSRHAKYFTALVEASYGRLWGPKQAETLSILESELDNLRTALAWMATDTGSEELLLRMAGSLWRFWEIHGYISEGRSWLDRALANNSISSPYLRANGLRGAGNLARQQGDYEQAKLMHEQSLELFHGMGDEYQLWTARELDVLGEIAQYQGDYTLATNLHSESLEIRYKIGDKEGIAISLGQLGVIALDQGRIQQARELLEESLKLNRELGDKLYTALSLNNLGFVAYHLCEYKHAISLFEEAVSIYRELNDRPGISNTLLNLGNVEKDQGELKLAKSYFSECLRIKKDIGDKRGIARANTALAEVIFLQGNYLRAMEMAEQSLSLSRDLSFKRGVIVSLVLMAYIAHYQGDYDRASSLAEESLALSSDLEYPRAMAYAKELFGLGAYAQGNLAKATELFQEALATFQLIDDKRSASYTMINLARTAYRQGEYDVATGFLNKSLTIARELETRWILSFVLEIKGLLERSQGHYQRAGQLFQESLLIAAEQDSQQGIANCLGALAGIAVMVKQPAYAARLFAASAKLRSAIGLKMGKDDQLEYNQHLTALGDQLDGAALQKAWSEGWNLTMEQMINETGKLDLVLGGDKSVGRQRPVVSYRL